MYQHLQTVSHYRSLLFARGSREFCCQLALSQGRTSASYFISIISNMVPHFMSHIHTSYISYLLCLITHKHFIFLSYLVSQADQSWSSSPFLGVISSVLSQEECEARCQVRQRDGLRRIETCKYFSRSWRTARTGGSQMRPSPSILSTAGSTHAPRTLLGRIPSRIVID